MTATPADAAEMRRLTAEALRAGAPGVSTPRTLNHRTATGDPTPSLRASAAELTAIADGVAVAAQVAPRPIGVLLGLQATLTPFSRCPTFAALAGRPLDQRVQAMHDGSFRAATLAEQAERRRQPDFERMLPFGEPPDYEPPREASIARTAERLGCSPAALAYDLLLDDGGLRRLVALANDPDMNVYMDLQPGEMQFINNFHVMHGRAAYEDDPANGYKRHPKRLWAERLLAAAGP